MRIVFRDPPYDLLLVAVTAAVLPGFASLGLGSLAGFAAAILIVLVLPGYAVTAAIFPEDGELDWLRRITLSVVVGLAVAALAGLASNYTPWGFQVETILVILDVIALGACTMAFIRRRRLPPERRLRLSLDLRTRRVSGLSRSERFLVGGLAIAVVAAGASLAYSATQPNPPPGYTEFALLNETGVRGGYPTDLAVGESATVILFIVNHEASPVNYTIEIWLATLNQVFDPGTGQNETVEVASVMPVREAVPLQDRQEQRIPYNFTIDQPGRYALKFFLFLGSPTLEPYREVRLLITVT